MQNSIACIFSSFVQHRLRTMDAIDCSTADSKLHQQACVGDFRFAENRVGGSEETLPPNSCSVAVLLFLETVDSTPLRGE